MFLVTDSYGIPNHFFGPIPGQFYAVIGRVTMLGALLEQRVLELLWAIDDEPQPVHAGKSVAELLRLIEKPPLSRSDATDDDVRDMLRRVRVVIEERNAVVHSLWPEATLRIAFRWRPRTLKRRANESEWMQGEFVTRKDLRGIVSRLVTVNDELATMSQRLHSHRVTMSTDG
ncbi:hypothetical protein SAMN05192575_109172 [Nocardioides alpinus]|nr:hypothetical protein SAMN05192575_109172 [Nocardioides alpinus]